MHSGLIPDAPMQSIRSRSTDWHDLLLVECDIRVASAEAALQQVSILPFWDELIQRSVEVLDPAVRARRFAHVDLRGGVGVWCDL